MFTQILLALGWAVLGGLDLFNVSVPLFQDVAERIQAAGARKKYRRLRGMLKLLLAVLIVVMAVLERCKLLSMPVYILVYACAAALLVGGLILLNLKYLGSTR